MGICRIFSAQLTCQLLFETRFLVKLAGSDCLFCFSMKVCACAEDNPRTAAGLRHPARSESYLAAMEPDFLREEERNFNMARTASS